MGLCVNDRGVVPDSARTAVRRARANGHLVFLCTGRSVSQLWPAIVDIGFDGVVAAAGGYVEVGGEVLANHGVAVDEVRHVSRVLRSNGTWTSCLSPTTDSSAAPTIQHRLRQLFYGTVH